MSEDVVPCISPSDPKLGTKEQPATPDAATIAHIRETYGMIILHPELETRAGLSSSYEQALTPAFGAAEDVDGMKIWRLR